MIDIILILILFGGAYSGYKRGFILEIIGLIALFLGIYGGLKLLNWGIGIIVEIFPEYNNFIPFIAFIIIFIVIIILVNILGKIIKNFIEMILLGPFDSIAGAILGFFKWAFIISLTLWFVNQANITIPEKFTARSYIYPAITDFAPMIGGYFSSIFPFAERLFEEVRELFKN